MKYLKEVNNIFNFFNIIKSSIILGFFIVIVDYLNIPTQFMEKDINLSSIVFLFLLILIIYEIIKSKRYKLIITKNINILDKNIFCIILSLIIPIFYLWFDFKIYKFIILLVFFMVTFALLLYRMIYVEYLFKKSKNQNCNTYDLKEFLEKDISKSNSNELILFNETDVKYDLLNRNIFVNYISSLINSCNPTESFVFGLNGAWGSGKSTILNLVKNKIESNEIIVIDDFDPWKYNSNETLFRGFYDSITKNKNFLFDYSLYKKFYNIYKVLILGSDSILNKVNFDIHFTDNNYSIDELKKNISTYLKLNNKKVVYIIDNIDRLNKEQILTIFKTISTLFDFNNFIYILSFDEDRVSNIFENELKIDPNYLNKIINTSISIPKTNCNVVSEIAINTITKLFDYYNINIDKIEFSRFIEMFSYLSKNFIDIRELKRFLNYISEYIHSKDIQEQVNIGDFIIIQLLKYLNYNLYNTIYNNPIFFVSEDTNLSNMQMDEYFFTEKFNNVAKEFYTKLFSIEENKKYEKIIARLFPYVDNYLKGYEIRTTIPFNHNQDLYNDSIIGKRVFNGRNFEHYFELTPNEYSNMLNDVNKFIDTINSEDNNDLIEIQYEKLIISDNINQRFKLEILNKSLGKIYNSQIKYLIDILYKSMDRVNAKSNGATMLGTRERCILILSDIFNIIDLESSKKYINDFIDKHNNLYDIDTLIYWMNPEKQHQRSLKKEVYEFTKERFVEKLNSIINNKIDTISNFEYGKFQILVLKKYSINIEKIKNYVEEIVNKENIFKFLRNFTNEWVGNGYSYEFNEQGLFELTSKEFIDNIISLIDYKLNVSQQCILDIYNKKVDSEKKYEVPIKYEEL